jgi:hypothetical protein
MQRVIAPLPNGVDKPGVEGKQKTRQQDKPESGAVVFRIL